MPTSDALPRKTVVLLVVAAVAVVVVFVAGLALGGSEEPGGGASARERLDEWVSPAPMRITDISSPDPGDCPVGASVTFTGSCRYDVAADDRGPFGLGLARAVTVTNTGSANVQLQLDLGGRLIPEDPGAVPDAALKTQESTDLTFGPNAAAFTMICVPSVTSFDCTVTFTADP